MTRNTSFSSRNSRKEAQHTGNPHITTKEKSVAQVVCGQNHTESGKTTLESTGKVEFRSNLLLFQRKEIYRSWYNFTAGNRKS